MSIKSFLSKVERALTLEIGGKKHSRHSKAGRKAKRKATKKRTATGRFKKR